jgi:hypothetical protein
MREDRRQYLPAHRQRPDASTGLQNAQRARIRHFIGFA